MIGVVDYGLGNVQAFLHIFKRLNVPATTLREPGGFEECDKIVLPGVGAFDWAMTRLNDSGMRAPLEHRVREEGIPVLGVCVGMQMLCSGSDEGEVPGLGWVDATVRRFESDRATQLLPLPHMGWNDVAPARTDSLLKELDDSRFYFLHSYYVDPARPEDVLAKTSYGFEFASAVQVDNIYGTQFHPEKSHQWGIDLLKNFAEI